LSRELNINFMFLVQVDSISTFIHQVTMLFWHNNIFIYVRQVAPVSACWLFKT